MSDINLYSDSVRGSSAGPFVPPEMVETQLVLPMQPDLDLEHAARARQMTIG